VGEKKDVWAEALGISDKKTKPIPNKVSCLSISN